MRHPRAAGLTATILTLTGWWALATGAGAHSPQGHMEVTAAEQTGASTVRLEVGIVYANDNELAEDATVTATLTDPTGASVGPVDVDHTRGGLYGTRIDVPTPGAWTVAISATNPTATATTTIAVTTAATATTEPVTTPPPATTPPPSPPTSESGPNAAVIVAGAAGVVVLASGLVGVVARKRTPRMPPTGS